MEKFCYSAGGERLDVFLAEKTGLSRSQIQKTIESGNVLLNETDAKRGAKLKKGDIVTFFAAAPTELTDVLPEDIPLEVLYEDTGMAIIDKPKGMVVHPSAGHFSGTLVNAVLYRFKGELSGINGVLRPGIVHRLDKDTSGVIAVAKNDVFHQSLSMQLQSREMSRLYDTVVHGVIREETGMIDKNIGRSPRDRKKMAVVANGKPAITNFFVTERFKKPFTRLDVKLNTGRTHQIRVHMAHINHPVVGDGVYGNNKPVFVGGQILHAKKIGFVHPISMKYVEVEAKLPEYFLEALDILRK